MMWCSSWRDRGLLQHLLNSLGKNSVDLVINVDLQRKWAFRYGLVRAKGISDAHVGLLTSPSLRNCVILRAPSKECNNAYLSFNLFFPQSTNSCTGWLIDQFNLSYFPGKQLQGAPGGELCPSKPIFCPPPLAIVVIGQDEISAIFTQRKHTIRFIRAFWLRASSLEIWFLLEFAQTSSHIYRYFLYYYHKSRKLREVKSVRQQHGISSSQNKIAAICRKAVYSFCGPGCYLIRQNLPRGFYSSCFRMQRRSYILGWLANTSIRHGVSCMNNH